jgi:hypothetical protein
MSDAMNNAADPVRFVRTEAVPTYPRKNIRLGDVPVGHWVEFASVNYVVAYKGDDFCSLLASSVNQVPVRVRATSPSHPAHVVTDYGPVEKITPDGEGGWRFTTSTPPSPPTVRLGDVDMLQVVRFPEGEVGVVLFMHGNPRLIWVSIHGFPTLKGSDILVTPLGLIEVDAT